MAIDPEVANPVRGAKLQRCLECARVLQNEPRNTGQGGGPLEFEHRRRRGGSEFNRLIAKRAAEAEPNQSLVDLQEFDIEEERGIRGNNAAHAAITVSEVSRDR